MPENAASPRNSSLWLGFVIAFAAMLCNIAIFLNPPAQSSIPWASLVLGVIAVVFIVSGIKNLFTQPRTVGARVLGVLVTLVALAFSAGSILFFVTARHVPQSTDAPQVGQKAPDFTLPDSNNQPVSLAQLLTTPGAAVGSVAAAPHSVLLVFYRGYW